MLIGHGLFPCLINVRICVWVNYGIYYYLSNSCSICASFGVLPEILIFFFFVDKLQYIQNRQKVSLTGKSLKLQGDCLYYNIKTLEWRVNFAVTCAAELHFLLTQRKQQLAKEDLRQKILLTMLLIDQSGSASSEEQGV